MDPAQTRSAARWRALLPVLALAGVIVVADQLVKLWIVNTIGRGQPIHEIVWVPGWLVLQYVENTGAAFGVLTNASWLLAVLAAVVSVAIVLTAPRLGAEVGVGRARRLLLLSLGLVLGGAVGNLIDRLMHGYVVDFVLVPSAHISLGGLTYQFPNFNVADSAITVGIVLLLFNLLFVSDRSG